MESNQLIESFNRTGEISDNTIAELQINHESRIALYQYITEIKNHEFVKSLLVKLIELRRDPESEIYCMVLMYACYLVSMHGDINDSLLIWKAKSVDFDTYCMLDVQLVVFAGADETIAFMEQQGSDQAKNAVEYLTDCKNAGDFHNLAIWFSKDPLPWYF